jgi:lysozyme family protein
MGNFNTAYEWMMDNEDAGRKYALVPDAPPGAHAISGINSAAFPNEFAVIAALPQAERAEPVKDFYKTHFWNRWFEEILSDEVVKRVFDAAVNMGEGTAVKLLQAATESAVGVSVGIDGVWGPRTLSGANNANPEMLSSAFKAARVSHYREIVMRRPSLALYLQNWIARAGK